MSVEIMYVMTVYVMTETMDDGSDAPTPVFVSASRAAMLGAIAGYVVSCHTGDGDYPENEEEAHDIVARVLAELDGQAWTPSLHHEVKVPELGRSLLLNSAVVA